MEINEIIAQLKDKFGDKLDITKVTELFNNGKSFSEIVESIKSKGILGDLDGDGKVESTFDELKGKAASMFCSGFAK